MCTKAKVDAPTTTTTEIKPLFTGPPRTVLFSEDIDTVIIKFLDRKARKALRQCSRYLRRTVDNTITRVRGERFYRHVDISTLLNTTWPVKELRLEGNYDNIRMGPFWGAAEEVQEGGDAADAQQQQQDEEESESDLEMDYNSDHSGGYASSFNGSDDEGQFNTMGFGNHHNLGEGGGGSPSWSDYTSDDDTDSDESVEFVVPGGGGHGDGDGNVGDANEQDDDNHDGIGGVDDGVLEGDGEAAFIAQQQEHLSMSDVRVGDGVVEQLAEALAAYTEQQQQQQKKKKREKIPNFKSTDIDALFAAHARLHTLEHFAVAGVGFPSTGLPALDAIACGTPNEGAFPNLKTLSIATLVPEQLQKQLAKAGFARRITKLQLDAEFSSSNFTEIVTNCTNLTDLDVKDFGVLEEEPLTATFSQQPNVLTNLVNLKLEFDSRNYTAGVVRALAFAQFPSLRCLDIASFVGPVSLSTWDQAKWTSHLVSLRITTQDFDDEGLGDLARLYFGKLEVLELTCSAATVTGIKALVDAYTNLPCLKVLWLDSAAFDGVCLQGLARFVHLTNLEIGCINDEALLALTGPFENLLYLGLGGLEHITVDGITAWSVAATKKFPKLKDLLIEFWERKDRIEYKAKRAGILAQLTGRDVKDCEKKSRKSKDKKAIKTSQEATL